MKNKLLLFDYDGVIVDSLEVIHKAFKNLQSKYNLPDLQTKEDVGKLLEKNFFKSLSQFGFTHEQAQSLLADLKEQKLAYQEELHIFPGMSELLEKISSLYYCMIITSTHEEFVHTFLEKNKLDGYFEEILGGNREPSKIKKIQDTLTQFGIDKKDAYFISDTTGDIHEGKEVGVVTIGITWGFHNKEKLEQSNPDHLFMNINDLSEFLTQSALIS